MRVAEHIYEREQGPVPCLDENLFELIIGDLIMLAALAKMNMCAFLRYLLPMMIARAVVFDAPDEIVEFGSPDGNDRIVIESSFLLDPVFKRSVLVEHALGFAVDAQYPLETSVFSCSHILVSFRLG